MVLTLNEQKLIAYLWRNYTQQLSINELSKRIYITPKGAYNILTKLEKIGIVTKNKIANASIYQFNYQSQKTKDIVEYALKSEESPNSYVKVIEKDLQPLKNITTTAILFGSILTKGLQAHDIDLFIIIDEKEMSSIYKKIKEFETISPKKIHLIIQTNVDMKKNLHKKDPVIIEILQKGHILWGYDQLYSFLEMTKNSGDL